jgi:hypothetical protein
MANNWNIGKTEEVLFKLFGREKEQLVLASIHSVWRRMEYARLHYHDAKSLADAYIDQNLKEKPFLMIAIHGSDEGEQKFNEFIYRAGAHITAFTQNLHAVADTLAYALYYALELEQVSKPLEEWEIDAGRVLKRMRRVSELTTAANLLRELVKGNAFRHLTALVNHSKHRALVLTSLTEDWTGKESQRHRLRLDYFFHNRRGYPAVDVTGFLSNEWDRCFKLGVDIGNELHAVLEGRLAAKAI